MKPLFTPLEFEEAKSRDLLPIECYICHSPFTTTKNEIQKSLKRQVEKNPRRNDLKYCSRKCTHEGKHNGKKIEDVVKVDRGYLEWLLAQKLESDQIDEDWIYTLKHHLEK